MHCSDRGDRLSIDQYGREIPITDEGQDSLGVDDGPEQREDKDLGCRNRQGRQVRHALLVASLPLHTEATSIKRQRTKLSFDSLLDTNTYQASIWMKLQRPNIKRHRKKLGLLCHFPY